MKNTVKKIVCFVLVLCMLVSVGVTLASCAPAEGTGEYTYNSWSTALGTNWNPHTWEMNADSTILGYLSSPFVSIEALDTKEGTYQWAYEMATSITDVTATNKADLTKYNVTLPEGKTVDDITSGYVFEIKLNPNAKWQTGELITATDYIESMKDLLDPTMKNYRANLYYAGESAVAGGLGYYNQGSLADMDNGSTEAYAALTDLVKGTDGKYTTAAGEPVWIMIGAGCDYLGGDSLVDYDDYYSAQGIYLFDTDAFAALVAAMDEDGNVALTDETWALLVTAISTQNWGEDETYAPAYLGYKQEFPVVEYDATVGCYKVDDYTIRYVCQNSIELNYFLTSCTDTWLVHQATYDRLKTEKDGLTVTTYGTSLDTTVSYGVYKLATYEDDKQVVFVQNENWYGWQTDEDGKLFSMTQFKVDGEYQPQYQTTKIVIDVMEEEVAKQKFFKGELMDYSPTSEELSSYATSDRLYTVDETYTMSFFFNTGLAALQKLDADGTNTNSVVLTNDNFRKAMSLAIDRADYVTVTQAWTPAFSLMNHLYHYDIYNDPTSSYRKSEEAMKAICNLYGVAYTDDNLKEVHDAITGYNLTEAKSLMTAACQELVAAGLYTEGQEIKIKIGWAKGALTADDHNQVAKLNQYINAALVGTGFGTITFEAVGNIDDRYADTASGVYAIGYGAWGGAAFYPFRNMQVYTNSEQYSLHEAGCWDPATETLTLVIEGENVTKTWKEWGDCLIGNGVYAGESNEFKLYVTAQLEEKFLAKYYRIPLAITTVCSILSYKVDEYTDSYNIMYGFGGFRLMSYNYDDAEWAAYVKAQGGTLNYN